MYLLHLVASDNMQGVSRFTIPLLLIDKLWVLVDVAYNFIVSIRIDF